MANAHASVEEDQQLCALVVPPHSQAFCITITRIVRIVIIIITLHHQFSPITPTQPLIPPRHHARYRIHHDINDSINDNDDDGLCRLCPPSPTLVLTVPSSPNQKN
jgi:hypothetical protein